MSRLLLIFAFFYVLIVVLLNSHGYFFYPPKNNPAIFVKEPLPFSEPEEVALKGRIVSLPEKSFQKMTFLLESESRNFGTSLAGQALQPTKVQGKVLVNHFIQDEDTSFSYNYGDKIEISGFLRLPQGAVNPGSFDYHKYLVRKRVYSILSVYSEEKIKKIPAPKRFSFISLAYASRKKILEIIKKNLPEEQSQILAGILLGEKSELAPETKKNFVDVGVMHILVVSGLNVGFLIAIFYWLFRWIFRIPRNWSKILLLPLIIFYLFLTGAEAPVVRASIMAICVIVALLLKRETSIYQALLLAGLIILLSNPQGLFDVSVQLSFAATIGIIYLTTKFFKPFLKTPKPLLYLSGCFFTSLAAQLSVNPLLAYYFHRISIVAILTNLFVVPLAGVILASGFLLVFSSLLGGIILFLVKQLNLLLLTALIKIVNFFALFPYAVINVPQPSWLFFSWYYFTLITVFKIKKSSFWRNFFFAGQIVCLTIFLSQHYLTNNQLQITFLSVGEGDAIFVQFPGGRNMLIDAGGGYAEPNSPSNPGERIIAPYLWSKGVWGIDRLILTHPDYAHYSGMLTILEKFKVKEFFTNPDFSTEEVYVGLREQIAKKKIPTRELWAGERLNFGRAEIKFLSPRILGGTKDDNVLAFQMKHKDFTIIFSGDLTPEGQRKLAREEIKSKILVLPAHGLRPLSEEFFKKVKPKYGIISTRQPAGGVLPAGLKIYSTHRHGAITLVTDGEKIKIQPYIK